MFGARVGEYDWCQGKQVMEITSATTDQTNQTTTR